MKCHDPYFTVQPTVSEKSDDEEGSEPGQMAPHKDIAEMSSEQIDNLLQVSLNLCILPCKQA